MQQRPHLDVAVAGGRGGRDHAQADEVTTLRRAGCLLERLDEAVFVSHEVVGGQHERDLVALTPSQDRGKPRRDRRRSGQRLSQHVVFGKLGQLCLGGPHMRLAVMT